MNLLQWLVVIVIFYLVLGCFLHQGSMSDNDQQ